MNDPVLANFLTTQRERGERLASESDLLSLHALPGDPPNKYIARFTCRGLVRDADGRVVEADEWHVGIWFPEDYLRAKSPFVVTLLAPSNAFHPNIEGRRHQLCIGDIEPSTTLDVILQRCFDVITGNVVNMDERNAWDPVACAWARRNRHRFPVDTRPSRRSGGRIVVRTVRADGETEPEAEGDGHD